MAVRLNISAAGMAAPWISSLVSGIGSIIQNREHLRAIAALALPAVKTSDDLYFR